MNEEAKTTAVIKDQLNEGWGGTTTNIKLPSGQKIIFQTKQEAILIFIGSKDIQDKIPDADKPVMYLIFHDGLKFVKLPLGAQLKDFTFHPYRFYYLRLDSQFKTDPNYNPMKDFFVRELGSEGETVATPEKLTGCQSIKLQMETIAKLNYERFNYPLREKQETD